MRCVLFLLIVLWPIYIVWPDGPKASAKGRGDNVPPVADEHGPQRRDIVADALQPQGAWPDLGGRENAAFFSGPPAAPTNLCVSCVKSTTGSGAKNPDGTSVVGQFGRVTRIADDNHPNLYWNRDEVDELRNMILVRMSPAHLVNTYNSTIRAAVPYPTPNDPAVQPYPHYLANFRATVSYMIEPTSAKADALKAVLINYMEQWPNGFGTWYQKGTNQILYLFDGYVAPLMYDLLMGYNRERLSAGEISALKHWFRKCAVNQTWDTRTYGTSWGFKPQSTYYIEGKPIVRFPNWYARFTGPGLAAAVMTDDQDLIDMLADSGWPHDLFTLDTVTSTWPPYPKTNRYDMLMYIFAVYPSGANTDSYDREGYDDVNKTWKTVSYTEGSYHWATMMPVMVAAEIAYHNGMTDIFNVTDRPGTLPGLLRTARKAIDARTERDFNPTNATRHPIIGWSPILYLTHRRYVDPKVEAAMPAVESANQEAFDIPADVLEVMGYPRRARKFTY